MAPLLAPTHPHRDRVVALLQAVRDALPHGFRILESAVALELTLFAPSDAPPGDPTNFLGGVADVLQRKVPVAHLGELAGVAVYGNDAQLRQIAFRQVRSDELGYEIVIREMPGGRLKVSRTPVAPRRSHVPSDGIQLKDIAAADDLAISFVNVMRRRTGGPGVVDYDSLAAWLSNQGAVPRTTAGELAERCHAEARDGIAAFAPARELAESLEMLLLGRSTDSSLGVLQVLHATCASLQRLGVDENGHLAAIAASSTSVADSVLCPVVNSALALLTERVRTRIRVCRDPNCARLFLDRTKNGSRIWCSMAICGNRAKQRTFHARHLKIEESAVGYVVT